MIPEKSHAGPKARIAIPAASRHTQPPKDAKRIYQNGACGHRCLEQSIITGRAFLTSKHGIVLGTNILFMLEFIIHSSASGICEKQDQKKIKQTPNFSKGSFLPL